MSCARRQLSKKVRSLSVSGKIEGDEVRAGGGRHRREGHRVEPRVRLGAEQHGAVDEGLLVGADVDGPAVADVERRAAAFLVVLLDPALHPRRA